WRFATRGPPTPDPRPWHIRDEHNGHTQRSAPQHGLSNPPRPTPPARSAARVRLLCLDERRAGEHGHGWARSTDLTRSQANPSADGRSARPFADPGERSLGFVCAAVPRTLTQAGYAKLPKARQAKLL